MNNAIKELIGHRKRRVEQLDNFTYATVGYLNKAQAEGQIDYEIKKAELRLKAKLVDRVIWTIIDRSNIEEGREIINELIK